MFLDSAGVNLQKFISLHYLDIFNTVKDWKEMDRKRFSAIMVVALLLMSASVIFARDSFYPLEPVALSSPRDTMESFINNTLEAAKAYQREDFGEAKRLAFRSIQCLNLEQELPDLKDIIGFESMLYLIEVLVRLEKPDFNTIPDLKQVKELRITSWTVPHTSITISLATDKTTGAKFLFDPETVKRSAEFFGAVRHLPYLWGLETAAVYQDITSHGGLFLKRKYLSELPGWAVIELSGLRLWQWGGLFLYIIIGSVTCLLCNAYGRKLLGFADNRLNTRLKSLIGGVILPLCIVAFSKVGVWFLAHGLHIYNINIYLPLAYIFLVLLSLASMWLVGSLLRILANVVIYLSGFNKDDMDTQLIRLGFEILLLVIIGIMLIDAGARLGLPTYSMVTGLGIGGVAVALAGREALSSLLGTIMIIVDRPFKPGDFIVVGDSDRGRVTQVGFRSTRIRTSDDTLISIPNSMVASMKIVNQSAPISNVRIQIPVGVAYDSSPKEVESALLKAAHRTESILGEPAPWVSFSGFGESSLNFSLVAWIARPEVRMKSTSQLNFSIHDEFQKSGIVMPFPQRDVHIVQNLQPESGSDTKID